MSGDFEKEMLVRTGRLLEKADHTEKAVQCLTDRVAALEGKSGKHWDTAVSAAISALVAGVVGFFSGSISAHIKP